MVFSSKQSSSRTKVGDLFEIKTARGLGYFQFVNKHAEFGQLVRALPGVHHERPADLTQLAAEKEAFFVFFPVAAAGSKGLVEKVGNFAIPIWAQGIPLMRRPGARGPGGKVLSWFIVNDRGEKLVKELDEGQRQLSLAVIWNDTLLAERIASGWKPSDDV